MGRSHQGVWIVCARTFNVPPSPYVWLVLLALVLTTDQSRSVLSKYQLQNDCWEPPPVFGHCSQASFMLQHSRCIAYLQLARTLS